MIKISILSIGKTKEKWLEEACSEYVKRLSYQVQFTFLWAKNDLQLIDWAVKESQVLCLDPSGQLLTSEKLADKLELSWIEGGSKLTLVIGGPKGLPLALKKFPLLSLSPLTFTHQIARLVLMEQIYRAVEIKKGTKYHK